MLEAIERIEQMTGLKLDWCCEDEARKGDHICYISNLGNFRPTIRTGKSRAD
jgi:CDP-paratose 2-epimerase